MHRTEAEAEARVLRGAEYSQKTGLLSASRRARSRDMTCNGDVMRGFRE